MDEKIFRAIKYELEEYKMYCDEGILLIQAKMYPSSNLIETVCKTVFNPDIKVLNEYLELLLKRVKTFCKCVGH